MQNITFIALLRGINLGSHKQIKMTDLKTLFESMNFSAVQTYIQSGNVLFKTNIDGITDLAKNIENAIEQRFSFFVPVVLRTIGDIEGILKTNPFLKHGDIDITKLHVTFLEKEPENELIDNIQHIDYSPDKFIIIKKEVFLYCPEGYGNTKLSNNFFESKLKVKATTRNWKTVNTLMEMGKK